MQPILREIAPYHKCPTANPEEPLREGTAVLQEGTIFLYEDSVLYQKHTRFEAYGPCEGEITTETLKQAISIAKANQLGGDGVAPIVKSVGEPSLRPGEYHPRVWRQVVGPSPDIYGREYTDNLVAFENLERDLAEIFRTLEPDARNNNAYGHRIRELLILACTEVENQLKEVLKVNGSDGERMPEYYKALPLLQLGEWKVKLKRYASYPEITPFGDWQPATSPFWYRAYNKAKHHRASSFDQATLSAAINAVAALGVLIMAQFGAGIVHNPFSADNYRMEAFDLHTVPEFPPESQYTPSFDGSGWTAVHAVL